MFTVIHSLATSGNRRKKLLLLSDDDAKNMDGKPISGFVFLLALSRYLFGFRIRRELMLANASTEAISDILG